MTQNTTSPVTEPRKPDQDAKAGSGPNRDIKSDDHGDFKVHVQLLGAEWSRTH